MDAGANWLGDDMRAGEAVFVEDVDVGVDLDVIRSFPSRIVRNGINEITQVDDARECWLPGHVEGGRGVWCEISREHSVRWSGGRWENSDRSSTRGLYHRAGS